MPSLILLAVASTATGSLQRWGCRFTHSYRKDTNDPSTKRWVRAYVLNNLAYCTILMPDRAQHLQEASRWSEEALHLSGSIAAFKGTRGSVLVELGRYDEGLRLLKEAQDEKGAPPASKAARAAYIALALRKQGRLEEANAYLVEARGVDPQCAELTRFDQEK